MDVKINADWKALLQEEFDKPYFEELTSFVRNEYATKRIYPAGRNIFRAFDMCPPDRVKVVIIGQDPYHEEGQANGLCFSVADGIKIPPSLVNIFKEIESDLGVRMSGYPDLEKWARQGVLLLNAVLTVRSGEAASHSKIGWEQFTDAVIRYISDNCEGVVFMLWGNFARSKAELIDRSKHVVLEAAHPSPLARGAFFGCRHFSKCNEFLKANGIEPVDWRIE